MDSSTLMLTGDVLCGDDQQAWQRFYELIAEVLLSIAATECEEQAA